MTAIPLSSGLLVLVTTPSSCLLDPFSSPGKFSVSETTLTAANLPLLHSGTGYIGSFTTLALLEAGYKVVVADNLYNSSPEALNRIELISGKKAEFAQLDVTDEAAFDKVFEAHPDIDSVIHFAALKVCPTLYSKPNFPFRDSPFALQ